jgi:hypothetical protein
MKMLITLPMKWFLPYIAKSRASGRPTFKGEVNCSGASNRSLSNPSGNVRVHGFALNDSCSLRAHRCGCLPTAHCSDTRLAGRCRCSSRWDRVSGRIPKVELMVIVDMPQIAPCRSSDVALRSTGSRPVRVAA